MKWVKTFQLINEYGKVIAEIDRLHDNIDGFKYRTVIGNTYQYFRNLKKAKKYVAKQFTCTMSEV